MSGTGSRRVALDGLRGLAAVAVVLHHCGHHLRMPWLVGHGAFAVDIFFAMSGFVLHRAYGPRLRGGWPASAFARARFARLYPMHALGLLAGLLVLSACAAASGITEAGGALLRAALAGALLMPDLSDPAGQVFALNAPSWSLLVEALASIAYGLGARHVSGRALATVLLVAAAGLAAAGLEGQPLLAGGAASSLGVDLLRGAFGFAAGIAIAEAEDRGGLGALARWPATLAFAPALALMLVPGGASGPGLEVAGIVAAAPLVVALAAAGRPPRRAAGWCAAGGALSYPLYALHAPLLFAAATFGLPFCGAAGPAVLLAACLACLALARLVAVRVEPRLVGALRGALEPADGAPRRRAPAPAVR